jgi:hypothetical protein
MVFETQEVIVQRLPRAAMSSNRELVTTETDCGSIPATIGFHL